MTMSASANMADWTARRNRGQPSAAPMIGTDNRSQPSGRPAGKEFEAPLVWMTGNSVRRLDGRKARRREPSAWTVNSPIGMRYATEAGTHITAPAAAWSSSGDRFSNLGAAALLAWPTRFYKIRAG